MSIERGTSEERSEGGDERLREEQSNMTALDLNADLGESFGRWVLGDDEAMLEVVTSANIACGFHAADPLVMRDTVRLAKRHGVGVGAHPSLPDLQGFGRREMAMSADQAQLLGALQSVSGKEFDALYLKQQTLAHRSALAVDQMYASSGDDPNLRQVVTSAVPLISSHGEMAYQAVTKLGIQ